MKKLESIILECLENSEIILDYNQKFYEYDDWDSLTAMMVIDNLEEIYKLEISVEEIQNLSFNELYEIISNGSIK